MSYLASHKWTALIAIALILSPAWADEYLPPDPSYSACWDASCPRAATPEAAAQDYVAACNQHYGFEACTLYRGPYQPTGGTNFWGPWYFQVNGEYGVVAINFYDGCPPDSSFMYDGDHAGMCLSESPSSPAIAVSTPVLEFGEQVVAVASASRSLTLTNTGTAPLTVSAVSVDGAHSAEFNVAANACSPVAPGASCQVNVTFLPLALGQRSAMLRISSDANNGEQLVSLVGTGVIMTTPDEGPHGAHGTLSGPVQLVASPWAGFGNAFRFDGNTSEITLGESAAHQFTGLPDGATRTIDVRFRTTAPWYENWGYTIMSRATTLNEEQNTIGAGDDWLLFVKGAFGLQDITFVYADAKGGASGISALIGDNRVSSQANVPHVVRITLLPSGIPMMQVDGGPTFAGASPVATSGVSRIATYVGGHPSAPYRGQRFPGYIDEVRFSNGIRTDAITAPYGVDGQVTALYHFDSQQGRTSAVAGSEPLSGAGTVQFATAADTAVEGAVVRIAVRRIGGDRGLAAATWALDGPASTANFGTDHDAAGGTLVWQDGDAAEKLIAITLIDDALAESAERIALNLSFVVGAKAGAQQSHVAFVDDDDGGVGSASLGGHVAELNNSIRAVSGQGPVAVCPARTFQAQEFSCDGSPQWTAPRAGKGERFYEDYGPGNSDYIILQCGESGVWELSDCGGGVYNPVIKGAPAQAFSALAPLANTLGTLLYLADPARLPVSEGASRDELRGQLGCQALESDEGCALRLVNNAATSAP